MVGIRRPANSGNRRWILSLLFVASLVLAATSFTWLLVRFSLPKENIIHIGNLSDFPPSDQPYYFNEPLIGFIINDGEKLVVLDSLNKVPGGYRVNWVNDYRMFIDPSTGSRFDLSGRPIVWTVSFPDARRIIAPQSLPRYKVILKGEEVWVNFSEETVEKYQSQASGVD